MSNTLATAGLKAEDPPNIRGVFFCGVYAEPRDQQGETAPHGALSTHLGSLVHSITAPTWQVLHIRKCVA